jgi:hypothetical protein
MQNWGLIDYIGVIGGLFFLFAFYRTSIGKWSGKSFWYEMDNLIGATLMSIYAYSKGAYVGIVLNIVWGIVAFRGVSSYAERRLYREINRDRKKLRKASRSFTKKSKKLFAK